MITSHFKLFNYFKYFNYNIYTRFYLSNNILSLQTNSYKNQYSTSYLYAKLSKKQFSPPKCINYEKKTSQELISLLNFYFNTNQFSKAFLTLDQIENIEPSVFDLNTSYNIAISKNIENSYLIFDYNTKSLKLGNILNSSNSSIKQKLVNVLEKSTSFQWNLYTYHSILKVNINNDNIIQFIENNIFIKKNCEPNIDTFQLLLQSPYNNTHNNIKKLINYMTQYNIIPNTKINSQLLKQLFILNYKDTFSKFVNRFSSSELSNLSAEVITLFLKENNDKMAVKFFNNITQFSDKFTYSISHYARFISYYAVRYKLSNVDKQLKLLKNKNFDWRENKFIISSLLAHPKQYNEFYEQAKYLINIIHPCVDTRLCDAFMKASNILNKPEDCINVYQILRDSNISNIKMGYFSYGYVITAFLQQNNMENVQSLIKEMKEKHFSLFSIYEIIIKYYVSNHDFDKANSTIKDIPYEDIAPQHCATLFIPLLNEYYAMKNFTKVNETLNTMKKMNIMQNVASYNAQIHGICIYKDPNNEKILKDIIIEMKNNNIKINDDSLNLIHIRYPNLIKKKDMQKETKSLNSYNNMIQQFVKKSQTKDAIKVINEIKEAGFKPSIKTFGLFLKNTPNVISISNTSIKTPLQTIYKNIDSSSSSITEFISNLEKRALLSTHVDSFYVLKYFNITKQYNRTIEMFWIYIYPNNMQDIQKIYPPCYYQLTAAYFKLKEYKKLDKVFSLMKQNNIILTSKEYSYKILSCIETRKLDTAISIVKHLQRTNDIKITPIMYYYLIEGLIKNNRTSEALDFLNEATNNNLCSSMLYNPFFESFSKENKDNNNDLLSYYSKMRTNTNIIPTYQTYSIIYNFLINQDPIDTNTIINILKDQSLLSYFTIERYVNIIQKLISVGCFNDDSEVDSLLTFINNELQKKTKQRTKKLLFLNGIILQYSSRYCAEKKLNNNEIKLFTYLFENIYPSIPANKTVILRKNINSSLIEIKQMFCDILNEQNKEI